jgi:coproporphyrinogen III oxidase-like Fe-S oxidoreductase
MSIVSRAAGYITRTEGKKFLKLCEEIDDSLITEENLVKGSDISLYIHIPFCRSLCPFCCFNRYLFRADKARDYFRNLKKELDLYIERGFKFSHFYFGGGTPTILMDELTDFIGYLKTKFAVKEISLETTPNEINPANIDSLKASGINRLSIGVQSFNDDISRAMGRVLCTGEEAKEKLLMAQGKFDTLNVDLIFNFPFQSLDTFKSDVEVFKNLGIDQVTFYPLMPSPHKKSAMERKFQHVDNRLENKYYDIILQEIYDKGYRASTVWCFSRGDRMMDEYIVNYSDYIGIGSGSVSLVKGNFYVNAFSLENYATLVNQNRFPIVRWRKLSHREYLRYYLLTKLFGMNVDAGEFCRDFAGDMHKKLALELLLLKAGGIVIEQDNGIKVTRRGMYTVSVMMREFFAALNTLREYCIENRI